MKVILGYLFAITINYHFLFAQGSVTVGPNEFIQTDPLRSTGECILAVNPSDPNHLLISVLSALPDDKAEDYYSLLLASFDEGTTWNISKSILPKAADPWCIILPNSKALFADISSGDSYVLTSRLSADGGLTWSDPVSFGKGHDHDIFLAHGDDVYLISTQKVIENSVVQNSILVARSLNNKYNFDQRYFNIPFPGAHINTKTPVVLSTGTIVIPVVVLGQYPKGEQIPTAPDQTQTWLIQTNDEGRTFSAPTLVTTVSGRRHNSLAVNKAKRWRDHLYYVFPGPKRNGLYFMKSVNKGKSWSDPIRLDKGASNTAWTDLGSIAVNEKGEIGILYCERVKETPERCYVMNFIASTDGGNTFLQPVRVSTAESCPLSANGWVGKAWPQGGDYCGLACLPNGIFYAAWSDARKGIFQLFSAKIEINHK